MKYSEKTLNYVNHWKSKKLTSDFTISEAKQLIYSETSFLYDQANSRERMYYVLHNIHEQVKCPNCGKNTKVKYYKGEYTIQFCSNKCNRSYIDQETGLSKYQSIALKSAQTMKKTDATGKNIYQKGKEKEVKTKEEQYREIGKKVSKSLNRKLENGLTVAQERAINVAKTLNTIQDNGLTIAQNAGVKLSKTLNKIQANGLSIAQERGEKTRITKATKDPITNQSINDTQGEKISKILNTTQESGLTLSQEIGIKSKNTLLKKDPNYYHKLADYIHNFMSEVEENGLTRYQNKGIKHSEYIKNNPIAHQNAINKMLKTRTKIDFNGFSSYDYTAFNNKKRSYDRMLSLFGDSFTFITSFNDYKIDKNNSLTYQCKTCNNIRTSYVPYIRCTTCLPYNKSKLENEVLDFCYRLNNNVESNDRKIIAPFELDIVVKEHNLAIEFDGLFFHSSHIVDNETPYYHLTKTQRCEEQGIQLFHIFENEWVDYSKQAIWKSIISNRLGKSERIYARKCDIRIVNNEDKRNYLIRNHLQGDCPSSVNLGLYYNDELVSLITFGKSRFNKKYDWELLRFCNTLNTSVVGGASKLLKHFRKYHTGSIISYADKRRSNGNLYKQLGFEHLHDSPPNYWYFRTSELVLHSRIKFQKHKLKDKLDYFNANLSESENMYNNGYRKIYDCGNQVWVLD